MFKERTHKKKKTVSEHTINVQKKKEEKKKEEKKQKEEKMKKEKSSRGCWLGALGLFLAGLPYIL